MSTPITAATVLPELSAESLPDLGPLAEVPGSWVGRGFTLISLPDKRDHTLIITIGGMEAGQKVTSHVRQVPIVGGGLTFSYAPAVQGRIRNSYVIRS